MGTKKPKTYKYYRSLRWKDKGSKLEMATQLYKVGLYVCLYIDGSPHQSSTTPIAGGNHQRKLLKQLEGDPDVTDIVRGSEIEAYKDEQGFWQEWTGEN